MAQIVGQNEDDVGQGPGVRGRLNSIEVRPGPGRLQVPPQVVIDLAESGTSGDQAPRRDGGPPPA